METLVALLAGIVVVVPLARWAGLGSIVGYLIAGLVIGPSGLGLVTQVTRIQDVSELGVVMLLFLIGLEIRPHRLWILRKTVLGLGLGQLIPCAAVLAVLAHTAGLAWNAAALVGLGLALSSTAIVLPMLSERNLLATAAGRDAFAVLLFQDMAFIPLIALVPAFGGAHLPAHLPWLEVGRGVLAIVAILAGGMLLAEPLFRAVGGTRTPEVFTATTLLIVTGTAALAQWAGLSASLGAFMAGALLSDSPFRHAIHAGVEPFQELLLGFFFILVGMSVDFSLFAAHTGTVLGAVAATIAVKYALGFALSFAKRRSIPSALRFAAALPESSEFSFVLFGAAVSAGVLAKTTADLANLTIAITMIATPLLFALVERLAIPRLASRKPTGTDVPPDTSTPVIICGFGRVGQIIGRLLSIRRIPYTALDNNPGHTVFVRRFGARAYFGDPTRAAILRAAGADSAKLLVIALDDMDQSLRLAEMAQRQFPHLKILARARNRRHAQLLMNLGIRHIVRETLLSSLQLGEMTLEALDISEPEARRTVAAFRDRDERMLRETQPYAADEPRVQARVQQSMHELEDLFEADRAEDEAKGEAEEAK